MSNVITIHSELEEAWRELKTRRRVYPEWIRRGTLSAPIAQRRLALMEAIVVRLQRIAEETREEPAHLTLTGD